MREGLKLYYQVAGLRGLLMGVLGTLTGSQNTMRVAIPGSAGVVMLRVPSTDVTTFREVLLREEYRLDVREPPETIVDAGANIGLASVYFAMQFPGARIIAIEPESENYELLEKNVAQYPNIEPVRAALWYEDAKVSVVDPGLGASGFMTAEKSVDERESVPAISLGTLMENHGLERVDLLKIDIEGAELSLFKHAKRWIEKVDAIAVELHDRIRPGCERAFLNATQGFGEVWTRGENTFCARPDARVRRPAEV